MKLSKNLLLLVGFVLGLSVLAYAATIFTVQRYSNMANGQLWLLQSDGTTTQLNSLKFGSDATTPAAPTATTGSNFSVKIPVFNVTTAAIAGTVLCTSNLGVGYVTPCTASDQKTVAGIAEGAIAVNAFGFASVSGYATVLTTGTVVPGDIVVSTVASTGYAATNNSFTAGTQIGIAMSTGTSAGGSTLVRLK